MKPKFHTLAYAFCTSITFCLLICLGCTGDRTQADTNGTDAAEQPAVETQKDTWKNDPLKRILGTWEGTLSIENIDSFQQRLPMALEILPTQDTLTYTFNITYGEGDSADRRAYRLIALDSNYSRFIVDENNGIKIETYRIDQHLMSCFEVNGNRIMTDHYIVFDQFFYNIVAMTAKPVSNTKVNAEDQDFEVRTFAIKSTQRAILRRKK